MSLEKHFGLWGFVGFLFGENERTMSYPMTISPVNHFLSINDSVDDRLLLEGVCGGLDKSRHESQLESVALGELVLVLFSQLDDGGHVQLVEGCEHGVGVLSLFEPTSDLLAHAVHLDPVLGTGAGNLLGGVGRRHPHDRGGPRRSCGGCSWLNVLSVPNNNNREHRLLCFYF